MGKFTNTTRLSKEEQNQLFITFAESLASLKNPLEAANFIRDLFSEQEALMLARRLQIAELIVEGLTYAQIRHEMKVSENTISRVKTWLELYGDGYRAVLKRIQVKPQVDREIAQPWNKLKRQYPMYFWPTILLDEIIKSANKKEKERLLRVVKSLREKTKLSVELHKLLSQANVVNKSHKTSI
ncbi:MAG: hypothetical protein JNN11_02540 [Candidatus Doudnabacteria bacterium]|nr:hypothetical protein [Candidatus Doudnabacteria bacterium]